MSTYKIRLSEVRSELDSVIEQVSEISNVTREEAARIVKVARAPDLSPVIAEASTREAAERITRSFDSIPASVVIEECGGGNTSARDGHGPSQKEPIIESVPDDFTAGGLSSVGPSLIDRDLFDSADLDARQHTSHILSRDGSDLVPVSRLGTTRLRTVDPDGGPRAGVPLTVRVEMKDEEDQTISVTSGSSGYATVDLSRFRRDTVERITVTPKEGERETGKTDKRQEKGTPEYELPIGADSGPTLIPIDEGFQVDPIDQDRFSGMGTMPDAADAKNAPELFNPTVIHEDGNCKLDFEATVETRHNRFHQIVRRDSPRLSGATTSDESREKIRGAIPTGTPQSERWVVSMEERETVLEMSDIIHSEQPVLGKLNAYEQTWNRVGHGVGKLLYSLALAPQEETKVAVIEWSREDRARRDEQTRANESLQHELHRDRMIEDIVHGSVDEIQQGASTSVQGGFGAATGFLSLGGGAAHSQSWSEGHRQMTLDTVQTLSDSVIQGSSSMRSLRSAVVTQSQQIEDETIRTRVVRNYNEHHALTVQYFQVLEHYRVTTRLAEQRDVLLIPYEIPDVLWEAVPSFDDITETVETTVTTSNGIWPWSNNTQETQKAVETVEIDSELIDWVDEHAEKLQQLVPSTYDDGFTALHRLVHTPEVYEKDDPVVTASRWTVNLRSAWRPGVSIILHTTDGQSVRLRHVSSREGSAVTEFRSDPVEIKTIDSVEVVFSPEEAIKTVREELIDTSSALGSELDAATDFLFGEDDPLVEEYQETQTYTLERFRVTAHTDPAEHLPQTRSYQILESGDDQELSADDPAISFSGLDLPSVDILQTETRRYRDYSDMRELLEHITANPMRYLHGTWLLEEASSRALRFDQYEYEYGDEDTDAVPLLELIENRPVGINGNLVAFPLLEDGQLKTGTRVTTDETITERLASLPTGGVFAETMLSRCMASEPRDVTRNVDVDESDQSSAPDITGVSPGSRAMEVTPSPTQLPQPLAGLRSAPSAPNPAGMDAGAQILGASSLFRDMSLGDQTVGAARTLAQQAIQESAQNYRQAAEAIASALTGVPINTDTSSDAVDPSVLESADDVPPQAANLAAGEGVRSASPDRTHDQLRNIEYARDQGLLDDPGAGLATSNLLGDTGTESQLFGDDGASSPQPDIDDEAAREYTLAMEGIGPWTWKARRLWILRERARTMRFPDEPETNVDRLPIPPWIDADQWREAIEDHYNNQHQQLLDENPDTDFSREPENIIGDFSASVEAEYFVIHDPVNVVDGEITDENIDGDNNPNDVHLWLGVDNLSLDVDWHEPGFGTKLDVVGNTNCFLHVEVSRAKPSNRDPGTGNFTFRQYYDLANAYIAASLRAGRFLAVTAHVEVDRAMVNGHQDPEDFNMDLFYTLINQSLRLGDSDDSSNGLGLAATFGITHDRANTDNRAGEINEFIPYHLGDVPKANQYGEILFGDAYKSYHRHHDADGPGGPDSNYDPDGLAAGRQCGGGDWQDEAQAPPIPSVLQGYIEQAEETDFDDGGGTWV